MKQCFLNQADENAPARDNELSCYVPSSEARSVCFSFLPLGVPGTLEAASWLSAKVRAESKCDELLSLLAAEGS